MEQSILVTGALGQIGAELVPALRARHGPERVVASDIRMPPTGAAAAAEGPFEHLDCTSMRAVQEVVRRHDVGAIYHLGGLLSAVAEERPQAAWHLNMGGLYRVLEVARQSGAAVFFPSSIGAFGPTTPREATPQDTIQRPTTMYGVTKVAAELLCDYYALRFGVDTRGLRLPGLISHVAPPGGGTTDYAVCQWRSKKGPPRRCKKGPLGGCGLVPVVHGRAPRATRRALNRLTRRRAREGPVGPRGQAWAGWSVQLAVGV